DQAAVDGGDVARTGEPQLRPQSFYGLSRNGSLEYDLRRNGLRRRAFRCHALPCVREEPAGTHDGTSQLSRNRRPAAGLCPWSCMTCHTSMSRTARDVTVAARECNADPLTVRRLGGRIATATDPAAWRQRSSRSIASHR